MAEANKLQTKKQSEAVNDSQHDVMELEHDVTRITNIVKNTTSHLNAQFEQMLDEARKLDSQVEAVNLRLNQEEGLRFEGYEELKTENTSVQDGLKKLSQTVVSDHGKLSIKQAELVQRTQLLDTAIVNLNGTVDVKHKEVSSTILYIKSEIQTKSEDLSRSLAENVALLKDRLEQLNMRFNTKLNQVQGQSETRYQQLQESITQSDLKHEVSLTTIREAMAASDKKQADDVAHLTQRDIQLESGLNKMAFQQAQTASKTYALEKETAQLFLQSSMLTQSVENLEAQQADAVAAQDDVNKSLKAKILSLADTESRHFKKTKIAGGIAVAMMLVSWGVFESQLKDQQSLIAQEQIAAVSANAAHQQVQQALASDVVNLKNTLAEQAATTQILIKDVNAKMQAQKVELSSAIVVVDTKVAVVDQRVDTTNAKALEVENNLTYNNTRFTGVFSSKMMNGSKGELLNANWLTGKDASHSTIVLMQNVAITDIYRAIEDYGFHMDTDVAAIAMQNSDKYYMVMGDYATNDNAYAKWQWLPFPLKTGQKGPVSFATLNTLLAKAK